MSFGVQSFSFGTVLKAEALNSKISTLNTNNGSDSFCNLLLLKDFLFLPQNIKNLIFQLLTKFRLLIFQKLSEPLILIYFKTTEIWTFMSDGKSFFAHQQLKKKSKISTLLTK